MAVALLGVPGALSQLSLASVSFFNLDEFWYPTVSAMKRFWLTPASLPPVKEKPNQLTWPIIRYLLVSVKMT